jgi:hypothetical protein
MKKHREDIKLIITEKGSETPNISVLPKTIPMKKSYDGKTKAEVIK